MNANMRRLTAVLMVSKDVEQRAALLVGPSYRVASYIRSRKSKVSGRASRMRKFHSQFEFGCEIVPVYVPVAVPAHRSNCVEIVPLPVALANAPAPPVTV